MTEPLTLIEVDAVGRDAVPREPGAALLRAGSGWVVLWWPAWNDAQIYYIGPL